MASTHVVLGAGPIGRTLTHHLAATGNDVVVANRSGASPRQRAGAQPATPELPPEVHQATVDASDARALTALAGGASTIYCCVNPTYHRWTTLWPPIIDALVAAARHTGATVVLTGNLYAYGPGHPYMTEDTPLGSTETKGVVRAQLWETLRAAHERGEIRATEVRGSDYIGPGAGTQAHAGDRLLKPLLAGRTVRPIGSADQPHSWTHLPDFARTLAAAGTNDAAWGHAWHVPSPEPLTFRQLTERFADAARIPRPRIAPIPIGVLRTVGLANPMLRELAAVSYQFTAPFVMDSTRSQQVLGVDPTPWDTLIATTWDAMR